VSPIPHFVELCVIYYEIADMALMYIITTTKLYLVAVYIGRALTRREGGGVRRTHGTRARTFEGPSVHVNIIASKSLQYILEKCSWLGFSSVQGLKI